MKKILSLTIILFLVLTVSAQVQIEKSTEKVIIDGQKYYIHTIQTGHTLYSISKAYNVSIDDIKTANPDIPEKLKLGDSIRIPIFDVYTTNSKYIIYVVKPGDTLYSLCRKYGITIDEFYEINDDLKKNAPLKAGQKIKLPAEIVETQIIEDCIDTARFTCHLVIKGETLYRLSKMYNVTKEEIIEANPNLDVRRLKVGSVVQIPKVSRQISDKELFMDSLSRINSKNILTQSDSIIEVDNTVVSPCDTSQWYKAERDFEITVLLPFDVNLNMQNLNNQSRISKRQAISDLSKNMVSFYAGILSAFDNIDLQDLNLKINVYDIGRDNKVLAELINDNKLINSDLIIGPAFKSQVEYINEKLISQDIPLILPFINDVDILRKYSNNIMITPNNFRVRQAIADFSSLDSNQNIIIIQASDAESIKNSSDYFRTFQHTNLPEGSVKIIKYDGKSLQSLSSIVQKDKHNIFISTINDEASITQIFTNLFTLKGYDMTFIGNMSILDFETIDPQYYSRVNFSYYTHSNIDYSNEETKEFLENFRETFLFEPDSYAFWGYDIMNYFTDLLMRYGKGFMECLGDDFGYKGQSGEFQFIHDRRYHNNSYSNKSIYIYTLQPDYSFKVVYPLNN